MRLLAIETATEACSAALFEDGQCVGNFHEVIGRGHAERLVPAIAELPGKGRAPQILVSLGPGSFTGVRIGLAAARALGLAWKAEVLGYPTMALVAAMAQGGRALPVSVCMTGGHGEVFLQHFDADGLPKDALVSLSLEDAARAPGHQLVAGTKAEALVLHRGSGTALPLLPDARHALAVPATLLSGDLAPIYGRPPDARLPGANLPGAAA